MWEMKKNEKKEEQKKWRTKKKKRGPKGRCPETAQQIEFLVWKSWGNWGRKNKILSTREKKTKKRKRKRKNEKWENGRTWQKMKENEPTENFCNFWAPYFLYVFFFAPPSPLTFGGSAQGRPEGIVGGRRAKHFQLWGCLRFSCETSPDAGRRRWPEKCGTVGVKIIF